MLPSSPTKCLVNLAGFDSNRSILFSIIQGPRLLSATRDNASLPLPIPCVSILRTSIFSIDKFRIGRVLVSIDGYRIFLSLREIKIRFFARITINDKTKVRDPAEAT